MSSDAARRAKKTRLAEIITARSLSTGADVKLASGRSSSFYFDMKPTMFDPEGANLIAELILDALAADEVDFIGGLEMGAVPIVAAVTQKSFATRPIAGFFVRKQPKDHGTKRLIEGLGPKASLDGKHVVLVEDVTTTGGSAMKAVAAVRDEGGLVAKVVTVVDREQGAADNFRAQDIELVALLTRADFAV